MSYDFRKTADSYQWWVQDNRPRRVLYGPYPSKEDAEAAQLLTLNCHKINEVLEAKGGSSWKRNLREYQDGPVWYTVGSATAEDLESLKADPESSDYRSVTVKSPTSLKMHPSWKSRPYGVEPKQAALYLVTNDRRLIQAAEKRPALDVYLAKYRKRHREPAKHMPPRVLEKSTGGSSGHGEARQHGDEIWLFPKFWEHDEKLRDWIMTHEIGHYWLARNNTQARRDAEAMGIDPWDTPNLPYGQFNFDEAFADCFAAYHLERPELQSRYPKWLELVRKTV